MPILTYPTADFTPFTKILSSDVNGKFNAIKTLLNTTGLDNTNIQNAGISITKLNGIGGSAGQYVGFNGTSMVFVSSPLTQQFNIIIGSAAQVTAGVATNSTFASWTQNDGDEVLVLPTYSGVESVTITKKVYIQGLGNTTNIQGAITFSTGSSYSRLSGVRTTSNLTINSGIVGLFVDQIWFSGTNTFVDNNNTVVNYLNGMQE